MRRASATFKGLTANVNKLHYTFVIRESDVQKGVIVVRRPRPKDMQVLFDIKEPDPQQIEFQDRTLRIYNPKTNTIREVPLEKKYGALVNEYMLLGFGSSPEDLQQGFTIGSSRPEAVDGQPATQIELTPKNADSTVHLIRADLWISDASGIAVQQRLQYAGGDYDLATYSNMKVRPDIPESAVRLNAPKDAKREK
jgi:outer membrane lipoprotein-sorting protein